MVSHSCKVRQSSLIAYLMVQVESTNNTYSGLKVLVNNVPEPSLE
jgi:hypothetical protein